MWKRYLKHSLLLFVFLCIPKAACAAFPKPQRSNDAMVVSAHPLASEAGITILEAGGNAIDAAVATTFAISTVEPFSAGIGGGGFLLVYDAATQQVHSLDFRERAPLAATEGMYLDEAGEVIPRSSIDGHRAVAVPGTVAGLYVVHQIYGNLPWEDVVQPSIDLARNGFPVSRRFVRFVERRRDVLMSNPAAREAFTRDGVLYEVGELLQQPDLATTLEQIAADPQSFYTGDIARSIVADMEANGGLVTLQDLAIYRPIWRTTLCGPFRQVQVCSMGPPSSGGVHLLQILNILGDTEIETWGWHHPDALHLLVEAMRVAYADRAEYLGDPDFTSVPVAELTSREYAELRRNGIDRERATPSSEVSAMDADTLQYLQESRDTSHLTVVDVDRNAVSLTFTVNGGFGAGVVAAGTGILLNNEMDDFSIAPGVPNLYGLVGGKANEIVPRKTPLSSMTPTIVTENGQLRIALGAPGGSTIITTVLQVLLNVLIYEMDAGAAVAAPRLHHQWLPDRLVLERWGFDVATTENLRDRGHEIVVWEGWGNANAIVVTPEGTLEGAADPRGEGTALGL
ncbi:MAG: gamma-glutamyltransferase [Cyanobacteria bacterium SID2]|nr:gamma-glutamyltransferase [Cyanobacteria bacterium SID2]